MQTDCVAAAVRDGEGEEKVPQLADQSVRFNQRLQDDGSKPRHWLSLPDSPPRNICPGRGTIAGKSIDWAGLTMLQLPFFQVPHKNLLHIERGIAGKPDIVVLGILSRSGSQRAVAAAALASPILQGLRAAAAWPGSSEYPENQASSALPLITQEPHPERELAHLNFVPQVHSEQRHSQREIAGFLDNTRGEILGHHRAQPPRRTALSSTAV